MKCKYSDLYNSHSWQDNLRYSYSLNYNLEVLLSQIIELKKVLDGHVSHNPEMTLYPGSHDVHVLRSVQLAQFAGQSKVFNFLN